MGRFFIVAGIFAAPAIIYAATALSDPSAQDILLAPVVPAGCFLAVTVFNAWPPTMACMFVAGGSVAAVLMLAARWHAQHRVGAGMFAAVLGAANVLALMLAVEMFG